MNSKWMVLSAAVLSACPQPVEGPCLENPTRCDASDAGVSDAGVVDAGNLTLIDWVDRRGEPHQLTESGPLPGKPWGVNAASFVLERNCDGGACDYEWRGDDGGLINARANLSPVATGVVTRDSLHASVLELSSRDLCTRGDGSTLNRFRGTWRLVSLLDGSTSAESALVTSDFLDDSFTREGGFARFNLIDDTTCEALGPRHRSTRAPFTEPRVLHGEPISTWVEAELSDGRFLLSLLPEKLVLVAPEDDQPWESLSSAATDFGHDGDFVHVYEGWPNREVVSSDVVNHVTKRTTLPFTESDWMSVPSADRFAIFRSHAAPDGMPFLFVDGRGELQMRKMKAGVFENSRPWAVAGRAGFTVFFDQTSGAMQRLNLHTGLVDALDAQPGPVKAVGGGHGVVVQGRTEFWVVTATQQLKLEGRPVRIVDAASMGGASSLPQMQTVLLVTASASGGSNGLTAWHLPTHRVVRLTDSLNLNEPFNAPYSVVERCQAPGFVRAMGGPKESATQVTSTIHFTEFVPSAASRERLFEVPTDLSAPPRLLVDVAQGQCATPLRAVNGGRFWVPLPGNDGTVRTLTGL